MTQIKPDHIIMTTLIDTYLNYDTVTSSVVISGTVGSGATLNFFASIPYTRTNTRADLYAKNTTTGEKRPISGGSRQAPYTLAGGETFTQGATYAADLIGITFSVFNGTGAGITLVTQTFDITAVLYQVPY